MANLIFVDIETTGLSASDDHILEIALVAVDEEFREVAHMTRVVWQPESSLERMNDFVFAMHEKSGLILEVLSADNQTQHLAAAQKQAVEFCGAYGKGGPICGSSIHFDRRFIELDMEELFACFNHRLFDTSTLIQAATLTDRLFPAPERPTAGKHRALKDARDSIEVARTILGIRWKE